ncbi:hypothetical protein J14TS2_17360 [Bacillus sp. J14TS2]|uniref:hypothetical protein n=1 Tax=Bacillus sp. J14TS2 TaxID=2807188 RepID=UPI001B122382|nr:hypothetical protein [Bacillus sp. J14TS2]GIN71261.1 hypothetical protein J14TS2_17360 [Bacillus sp. J14TS2]
MGKNRETQEFITKKDLSYVIAFLIFALILIFTWRAGGVEVLVNQISLVGSISSILLALIAIGYAFFQTNNSSWENRQLSDTLGRVNDKVEELGQIKDEMAVIKDELSKFKEISNDSMSNMMAAISELPNQLNFDAFSSLLKEHGITIPDNAEGDLKAKYQKKINSEVDKIKKEMTRLDSKIETDIANFVNFEVELGEEITPSKVYAYLDANGVIYEDQDVRNALRKFLRVGLVRKEFVHGKNKKIMRYYKSGEFKVFERKGKDEG